MSKLHIKKLAVAVAALGAVAVGSGVAQAASTNNTFNVAITLTSTCQISSIADVTFLYTSFAGGNTAPQPGSGAYTVTCTNSLPYTFGLNAGLSTTAPGNPKGTPITVTDAAVGIQYTLDLSNAGGTGNGAAQAYSITGNIAGPQAGTCATLGGVCNNSGSANKTQTLIVNF